MAAQGKASGPDLTQGIGIEDIPENGMVVGKVGDSSVLVVRRAAEVFAVSAHCSHYGGPLVDGVVEGDTVRCPWHHACFSLRTGEALRAPAFDPLTCWRVERQGDKLFVRESLSTEPQRRPAPVDGLVVGGAKSDQRFVIIGGGAAGFAAAERLRREGFSGAITIISAESARPVDRPNLSKDYLAGSAPEDWVYIKSPSFFIEHKIELELGAEVEAIDTLKRVVSLADGRVFGFDKLLIATGAEPIRLKIPGADLPHVRTLRSLDDSRGIIEAAKTAKRVVVLGSGFLGLEAAAALRGRGLDVHVVAPETYPLEKVLGPDLGKFILALHAGRGVTFHAGRTAATIDAKQVTLDNGETLAADLVIVAVGVKPRTGLAKAAGLKVDNGVLVDAYFETSAHGIFAAGDIARYPDPRGGGTLRIEHWALAEETGAAAALNMLGRRQKFAHTPFFWSQHYDVPINYVGHAADWDATEIEGDVMSGDCLVRFRKHGRLLAVASIYRDVDSLKAEIAMDRDLDVTTGAGGSSEAREPA